MSEFCLLVLKRSSTCGQNNGGETLDSQIWGRDTMDEYGSMVEKHARDPSLVRVKLVSRLKHFESQRTLAHTLACIISIEGNPSHKRTIKQHPRVWLHTMHLFGTSNSLCVRHASLPKFREHEVLEIQVNSESPTMGIQSLEILVTGTHVIAAICCSVLVLLSQIALGRMLQAVEKCSDRLRLDFVTKRAIVW